VSAYRTCMAARSRSRGPDPRSWPPATTYKTQLANAHKFAPELAVIQANRPVHQTARSPTRPPSRRNGGPAVLLPRRGPRRGSPFCPLSTPTPAIKAHSRWHPSGHRGPLCCPLTSLSRPTAGVPYLNAHAAVVPEAAAQASRPMKTVWGASAASSSSCSPSRSLRGRCEPSDARRD